MHENKEIRIMNIQYNLLTQGPVKFHHWVIQVILKLFCLKLGLYLFTQLLYDNWNDLWLSPFLQVKDSSVNSAGGSFCWNYATNIFYSNYAGANIYCNYAGFDVLLKLCGWYFLRHLCWWIFLLQLWQCCKQANFVGPVKMWKLWKLKQGV